LLTEGCYTCSSGIASTWKIFWVPCWHLLIIYLWILNRSILYMFGSNSVPCPSTLQPVHEESLKGFARDVRKACNAGLSLGRCKLSDDATPFPFPKQCQALCSGRASPWPLSDTRDQVICVTACFCLQLPLCAVWTLVCLSPKCGLQHKSQQPPALFQRKGPDSPCAPEIGPSIFPSFLPGTSRPFVSSSLLFFHPVTISWPRG